MAGPPFSTAHSSLVRCSSSARALSRSPPLAKSLKESQFSFSARSMRRMSERSPDGTVVAEEGVIQVMSH